MQRTVLKNTEDTKWWRRSFFGIQLHCPYCFEWFRLGKDFKIDKEGNVNSVVYHICDDRYDSPEAEFGWVVLPQLLPWGDKG